MKKFLKSYCKKTRTAFAFVYSRDCLRDIKSEALALTDRLISLKDPAINLLAGAAFLLFGPVLIPLAALYVTISEARRNGKA